MRKSGRVWKAAFPLTVPVLAGYLFIGIAFGMLLQSRGYSALWAVLMSAFVFAGSMQFVAVSLLAPPLNLLNIAILTLTVNARHLFYGVSMLGKFRGAGWRKPYLVFALTDETFSLLCSAQPPEGEDPHRFYFAVSLLDHLYWILGSGLGGLLGSVLPINTQGIDFVMTALFLVIFLDQWKAAGTHIPALTGLLGSAACLLLCGADRFLPLAMLLILVLLACLREPLERRGA